MIEREEESERECVCVKEREIVSVCVDETKRECVCVSEREREREKGTKAALPCGAAARAAHIHIRQARPDSGFDFQMKVLQTFQHLPSSL